MSFDLWTKKKAFGRWAWGRLRHLCLVGAFLVLPAVDQVSFAEETKIYRMVVGNSTGRSYSVGIGIASLVKVKLLPRAGIDMNAIETPGNVEALVSLSRGEADFALLSDFWDDLVSAEPGVAAGQVFARNIEAVATLWSDGARSTQLVARQDVDPDAVYEVIKTIYDHLDFLQHVDDSIDGTALDRALADVSLPLHEGAYRYYEHIGIDARDDAGSDDRFSQQVEEARTFTIYFDLDEATISEDGAAILDELETFAQGLEVPAVWVAGYTDTSGDADYNLYLADQRANAVLAELKSRQIGARAMDVTALGERSPWVVTADETFEARNRRVEVLVEPLPKDRIAIDRAAASSPRREPVKSDGLRPIF